MPLENGAPFAGYTVRRLLGRGGMGDVYLVEHPRLPRLDALKVLRENPEVNDEYRERFNREAELAATLWHPHIVGLHDRGEFQSRLWISMDYVDGTDAARLQRDRFPRGVPLEFVTSIVESVASALDYAHGRGLLHRDVKPANILIGEGGGIRRILLSDFGIARMIGHVSGLTAANTTVGTVAFSAPEQLMNGFIDGRADQYSLAATAFRLLTGTSPFRESNPVAVISAHLQAPPPRVGMVRPDLAPLDDVLMKAMAKNPDDRFATSGQFAQAFAERAAAILGMGSGRPPGAPPPVQAVPPVGSVSGQLVFAPAPRRTRKWPAIAAGVVVVALVAAGSVVALNSGEDASTAASTTARSSTSRTTSSTADAPPTLSPPILVGTPGKYQTIANYLDSRKITTEFQHRGDGNAPTVTLPIPEDKRWHDGGLDTPNFAYEMLVYNLDAPFAGPYPPFVVSTVLKLIGNVDPQSLFLRASGDLNNRPGFVPDNPGRTGYLSGHPEFSLSGTWDRDPGVRQILGQKIVLCKWRQGYYLIQIDFIAAPEDRAIFESAMAAVDDRIVIIGP
ncbi:protein kinase domain-containing protein [Mycolicibacterium sediminis]|uniref:non-specific serine/threonine protein kinase n=1 Tax=Mycolicibacterium sediminis TaxID=1286180 RepID=A0A7I7QWV1_9MYCO|nr:LpqN/LpqT family lipoprotein [Mycolicibacterium sediminis]BBY30853.1 hypothetical protein MSEDJ_49490 [Mycolicibacterium sediminis]